MNAAQPPPTPPGWHPDHRDPGLLRYWDGTNWTEHTHPKFSNRPTPQKATDSGSRWMAGLLSWALRHKIVSVIAVLVVIGLIGSAFDTEPKDSTAAKPRSLTSEPSSSPTEAAPSADPAASTEPQPAAAPAPTAREVWIANYAAQEPSYLIAVAAALGVAAAPAGSDASAIKTCAELGKQLPLQQRVARLGRRAGVTPTVDQGVAAINATVSAICPEMAVTQTTQVAERTAAINKARAIAKKKQRAAQAAAKAAEEAAEEPNINVYYDNCSDVEAAGAAPIYSGDPGYRSDLDRDGDGVACET